MPEPTDNLPSHYSLRQVRIVCAIVIAQALIFGGIAARASHIIFVQHHPLTPKFLMGYVLISALACVHVAVAAWMLVRPHHRYQQAARITIGSPLLIPSVVMVVALPVAIILYFL